MTARKKPPAAVVELHGELTIQTAAEQYGILMNALQTSAAIHLDLAHITELDTAGVQLLLLTRREAEQRGLPFALDRVAPGVADTLAIAGLDTGLNSDPYPGVDVAADLEPIGASQQGAS